MPPRISVLLPFHDAADTLAGCLEDIRRQSFPDWELLAMDDGSADNGPRIVEQLARQDERVRLFRLKRGGIVEALNQGLAQARGEFLARMDADDRMHNRRLKDQLATLEELEAGSGGAGSGGAGSGVLLGSLVEPFSIGGHPLSKGMIRYHNWMNRHLGHALISGAMFVEAPVSHPSFFARTELFRGLGGYRQVPWPEDYDMLLRALRQGVRFEKTPRMLVRRGDWPGRLTRTDPVYNRQAMGLAKAWHIVRGPWFDPRRDAAAGSASDADRLPSGFGREVVIGGTGTSGRMMARHLREFGVVIRAFLDNTPGHPGRRVMGVPTYGFPDEIPDGFIREHQDAFFLSCIGQPEGRGRMLCQLRRNGMEVGRDWLALM